MKRYLLILLLFISCLKDELTVINIPERIITHYEMFLYEAELRGVYLSDISLTIIETKKPFESGSMAQSFKNEGHITIDTTQFNKYPDLTREFIIFHELGHYLLNRPHTYDQLEDFSPASIMYWNDWAYYKGTREELREYYLDELFGI